MYLVLYQIMKQPYLPSFGPAPERAALKGCRRCLDRLLEILARTKERLKNQGAVVNPNIPDKFLTVFPVRYEGRTFDSIGEIEAEIVLVQDCIDYLLEIN